MKTFKSQPTWGSRLMELMGPSGHLERRKSMVSHHLPFCQTLWPSCSESLQPVDKQSSSGTQRLVTEMLFPETSMVC